MAGKRIHYVAIFFSAVFVCTSVVYVSRNDENFTEHRCFYDGGMREMADNLGKQSSTITKSDLFHIRVETDRQLITRFQQRKAHLQEQCALKRIPDHVRDVALEPPKQLIVNEEYRIIYCNVPKVACSSWKTVFLKLGKFDNLNTSLGDHLGPNAKGKLYLNYLHKYPDISQRRFMLQNYTKFFFVRHPFTRILSAFQEKLAPNISGYFHYGGQHEQWLSKYGKDIIERYRGKSEADRVSSSWEKEYDLTFLEFLRFLVDPDTDSYNKHWSDMHELCLPCHIDYDIIGHFETINEDADFILRLAKVGSETTFPQPDVIHRTNSSDPSNTGTFFGHIPKPLLYKLAMLYATDFSLFGYDTYPYLQL